jgi:hypothetical protein
MFFHAYFPFMLYIFVQTNSHTHEGTIFDHGTTTTRTTPPIPSTPTSLIWQTTVTTTSNRILVLASPNTTATKHMAETLVHVRRATTNIHILTNNINPATTNTTMSITTNTSITVTHQSLQLPGRYTVTTAVTYTADTISLVSVTEGAAAHFFHITDVVRPFVYRNVDIVSTGARFMEVGIVSGVEWLWVHRCQRSWVFRCRDVIELFEPVGLWLLLLLF